MHRGSYCTDEVDGRDCAMSAMLQIIADWLSERSRPGEARALGPSEREPGVTVLVYLNFHISEHIYIRSAHTEHGAQAAGGD